MVRGLARFSDLLYATVFGALVALGVWVAVDELAAGLGARASAFQGWNILGLAIAVCAGIAAARGVRWHRAHSAD